jgi:hypothetical protein
MDEFKNEIQNAKLYGDSAELLTRGAGVTK